MFLNKLQITYSCYAVLLSLQIVGNKAKGRISKRVFQENNAPKCTPIVSGGKKCSFFGKFGVLCFLETLVNILTVGTMKN